MSKDEVFFIMDNWQLLLIIGFCTLFIIYTIYQLRMLYKESKCKYREINKELHLEIIERDIRQMDGHQFEHFMAYLFNKCGYKVFKCPQTRDGGKDLILNNDTYVELKCYNDKNLIGENIIKKLYASAKGDGINKCLIITTSSYQKSALELINKYNKIDIDYRYWYIRDILRLCDTVDTEDILIWLGYDVDYVYKTA